MALIVKNPFNFKLGWTDSHPRPEQSKQYSQKGGFIKLIVGLGNIGDKYKEDRHNIGFKILDAFSKQEGFPGFKENKKFFGLTSEKFIDGKKIILLKPSTMMNLSGKSVLALKNFYNIPEEDIIIVHDELDLNFSIIKFKSGGEGKSTHNGLRDISKNISSNNFNRIRFGIKNKDLDIIDTKKFVLSRFNPTEKKALPSLIKESMDLIKLNL